MKLGQPSHLKEKAKGGFTDRVRLDDGENTHRVIYGPVKVQYIYYPTLQQDESTSELKQSVRVIKRPQEGCILDSLASFEKRIRTQRGEKNPRSNLSPRTKWLYLVISRNEEEEPSIKIAEYPFKVYDQIIKIEAAKSSKNPNKLRHGLIFMYDLIITKSVEKGKPRQYGTSYHVEVDPENQWSGKIPVGALGMPAEELEKKLKGFQKFFSKEDWELIENMDINLEEEGAPDEPETIASKLQENPIYLNATNPDGSYMFPAIEDFKEQLLESGIEFTESGRKKPTSKALSDGSDKTFKDIDSKVELEEEEEEDIQDVEFEEEVEEEEPPKKKKGKKKKPEPEEEEEEEEEEEFEEEEEEEEEEEPPKKKKKSSKSKKNKKQKEEEEEEGDELDELDDLDW